MSASVYLVEHARVQLSGQQIVGGGDGVDVAREVEVEILHRDHLLGLEGYNRVRLHERGAHAISAEYWNN
jgi:hypothetical protein